MHVYSITYFIGSSYSCVMLIPHADIDDLERVLRDAIIKGQPGKNRSWKKILIVVEGVYRCVNIFMRCNSMSYFSFFSHSVWRVHVLICQKL